MKPLYYYFQNQKKFFFFSSIKSILLSLDKRNINIAAFNSYTNFGRNDSVETIFKEIYKLLPGELLILKENKITKKKILKNEIN